MSATRFGVTGPASAYLGFVAKAAGAPPGPGLQSRVTRFGVCGPSASYLGFVAKGASAPPPGPGFTRLHDMGTVVFTQIVRKMARID